MNQPPDPSTQLRARTSAADVDTDMVEFAAHDGVLFAGPERALAGRGLAQRIDLPPPWTDHISEIPAALAAIGADIAPDADPTSPGRGPVAFGALPFDTDAPATLVVPAEIRGQSHDGARWRTTLDPAAAAPVRPPRVELPGRSLPSRYEVAASTPAEAWCELVVQVRARVRSGAIDKAVLARRVTVSADGPIPLAAVLGELRQSYPGCYLFSIEGFVGASPELLVSRVGDVVRAHPMAGTIPHTGDPGTDAQRAAELLASPKDRKEHQITIDMVHDTLLPWCSYLDYQPSPSVVPMANVSHLASLVEGRLSSPAPAVTEMVAALHPTPAVCGSPRSAARALILELEGLDRGRYAGPVGWVDRNGFGEWAVGIRSAEIEGRRAHLFAGVGVVADSDPLVELAETRAKLKPLLTALIQP
ncbi:MAG: Isochorismate synthase DhbC [Acidimicrobiales bacterium]|nr:MAG: isochorismate synthase [Actinomycetota bacterium]MBV6509595.1 Isochorismate synthase DhbC [Acidimicrobiales bacterium]RIK06543.1 MAG: isochorismate synthase [Acidobacteriota bacterium]